MRCCLRWPSLLFFALPFLIPPAHAQGRIDCNAIQSRILAQTVRYCVMLPPDYDNATGGQPSNRNPRRYPVLYFLHGLGDTEQTLFKGGGWDVVQELRRQGKITDFLIVAAEGKSGFYINSADGHTRYSDFFIREFIPYIESHYSIRRDRSARGISGVSMGGYGALRFALAYPEMFGSVSAESAALISETPRPINTQSEKAGDGPFGGLQGMLGAVFGNPVDISHWKQNSPFFLAKQNRARIRAARLSIYFNCGRDDEFGFEKGSDELNKQLTAEGIQHEYHLYPGNHGAEYFLAHLGETLEFHSRVFSKAK
jgi:S-formylglutathione hydrolase FrmB